MTPHSLVLVVDDEPRNAKLLEALLVPQGYQVLSVANGAEALAAAAERPVDLILLDVMMPELDGFEVTRRLRAQERTRLLPIVLVTALKGTEDRIRGIEAGCDDFISKPFDRHEVLARVKTLLTLNYYRRLLDDKEKLDYVIDHIEDGIALLDAQLRPTRLNRQAAVLLAIDPADPPADLLAHLAVRFTIHFSGDLAAAIRSEPVAFDVERRETETARCLILDVRSSVVKDPAGSIASIVLTIHDVTERRREEFLKQDFLSLISHKLRTPLAVILSYASMLQEGFFGALNEQQAQSAAVITKKSLALKSLIEKLLLFTTLRSQGMTEPAEPLVLATHLPPLLEGLVKQLTDKPVDYRLACDDPQAALAVNPSSFELVLANLVENAIKFNDHERVELAVSVTAANQHVELTVRDNGRGIPPEEQPRIFDAFYQIEKYFTGNVEGAGLGLALVKHVVVGLGGDIRVESELGRGSTFTIRFPRR